MADEAKAKALAAPLIRESEGLRLVPYLCPAGYLTVGYGHRTDSKKTISIGQAHAWLIDDLAIARSVVGDDVAIRCNTNQLAALLSFTFNVPPAQYATSTLRRLILLGRMKEAASQFPRWNKATINGVLTVLPGLVIRREAEMTLFTCTRNLND